MLQSWSHLLFLHWTVPVEALRRRLPASLEVEAFEGRAYVGLVPFTIHGVRPPRLPGLPGLKRFHEVNLRTYVRPPGGEPGVFFFSLDAASRLAVLGARAWYRLPYHFARIEMRAEGGGGGAPGWRYRSRRLWPAPIPATCALHYSPRGTPAPAREGTLEHFLVERYVLYTNWRGGLWQSRVRHAPYPLQPAAWEGLEESLSAAAGVPGPHGPLLAHYAEGVSVEVFGPTVVAAAATGGT
jgi:uncharacterized protein